MDEKNQQSPIEKVALAIWLSGVVYIFILPLVASKRIVDGGRITYFLLPGLMVAVIKAITDGVAPVKFGVVTKKESPGGYWFMVSFYALLLLLDVGYVGYRLFVMNHF